MRKISALFDNVNNGLLVSKESRRGIVQARLIQGIATRREKTRGNCGPRNGAVEGGQGSWIASIIGSIEAPAAPCRATAGFVSMNKERLPGGARIGRVVEHRPECNLDANQNKLQLSWHQSYYCRRLR